MNFAEEERTRWLHPGGKLRELGPECLSESELLAILIGTGIKGRSALQIARDVINKYGSLTSLSNRPLDEFLKIKGLSEVKIIRIAAAFEIARRIAMEETDDKEKDR